MVVKYFVNGEKDGYTWRQLLYWCYTHIANFEWKYTDPTNGRRRYGYFPTTSSKDPYFMKSFFCNFKHHENDGIWTEGYWNEKYHYENIFDEKLNRNVTIRVVDSKEWIPRKFTPKKWQITDSYGRVISGGFLHQEYLKYWPNDCDKRPELKNRRKLSKYRQKQEWLEKQGYKFRSGPVPGVSRWRRRYRHPKANHGGTIGEMRSWYGDRIEARDILEEFGITFKVKGKRSARELDPWEWKDRHWNREHGWKRTVKEKQWMRGYKKLCPLLD